MNNLAGPIAGMERFIARKKTIELLELEGTLISQEDYIHSVGFSERGGEQIEPFLSDQWFMSMKELSKPAIEVVNIGLIKIHPEHWTKTYNCLLYTSDAADERSSVDLGGRRIIKKNINDQIKSRIQLPHTAHEHVTTEIE